MCISPSCSLFHLCRLYNHYQPLPKASSSIFSPPSFPFVPLFLFFSFSLLPSFCSYRAGIVLPLILFLLLGAARVCYSRPAPCQPVASAPSPLLSLDFSVVSPWPAWNSIKLRYKLDLAMRDIIWTRRVPTRDTEFPWEWVPKVTREKIGLGWIRLGTRSLGLSSETLWLLAGIRFDPFRRRLGGSPLSAVPPWYVHVDVLRAETRMSVCLIASEFIRVTNDSPVIEPMFLGDNSQVLWRS